jgi:predicted unusual protein kinase regulating ubiquinone biosynthesis (AarF/ABC1/UbiB family)
LLSQRELARELGVANGTLAQWESGVREIPAPVLKLLGAYECELRLVRTGWVSRNLKLAALTAKMAAGLADPLARRVGARRKSPAHEIARTLGQLKGLPMKLGQMMGYIDAGIPEAARAALAGLCENSPPLAAPEISQVIEAELGAPPKRLFQDWSERPLAAASIGQVHWARLRDGREVAVKVQYPGMVRAIESDLRNVQALSRLSGVILPRQDRASFVEEVSRRLREECDYVAEARHQKLAQTVFGEDPAVRVPGVIRELSTRRVLTSEYCPGRSFRAFLRSSGQAERNRAGETVFRAVFRAFFRHGFFNADPHPGNYLFQRDRVVLLDYGCVKRLTPGAIAQWRRFFRAVFESDLPALRSIIDEMGMAPRPKRFDYGYFLRALRHIGSPWIADGRFTFTPEFVRETWLKLTRDNPSLAETNLPRDWIFMNRLQWGLFSVLASLGSEGNWRELVLPLIYEEG